MAHRGKYLDAAVERTSIGARDRCGVTVERIVLPDGRRLVVKRVAPAEDLRIALSGDAIGREYLVWSRGILDALPSSVAHAVVDGWLERDGSVVVMDDLTDALVNPCRRLGAHDVRVILGGIGDLHREFLGRAPENLTPLPLLLTAFAPDRIRVYVGCGSDLPAVVLRGWEAFDDLVPDVLSAAVFSLLTDPQPLATALLACPSTLVHGDLSTGNMAIRDGTLTLIDWTMSAEAPAALDIAWLLARSSSVLDLSREDVLAESAKRSGGAADPTATRLALLAGLTAWGWSMALAVTQPPDLETRERAWADLDWWVREARRTLEAALI